MAARNLLEVYGVLALEKHNEGYILINNYPVSTIQIFGRVLWYSYKNFDRGPQKNPYNFLLMQLDDCSGDDLAIVVKISESLLPFSLNDFTENLLVEVTGTVSHVLDYDKQVIGSSLRILGHHSETEVELQCWHRILSTRRFLCHQWRCVPDRPIPIDSDDIMELQPVENERERNAETGSREAPSVIDLSLENSSSPIPSLVYYSANDNIYSSSSSPQANPNLYFAVTPSHSSPSKMSTPPSESRSKHADPSAPKRKRITIPLFLRDSQNRRYQPSMHIVDSTDSDGSISDPIVSDSSHPTRNLLVIIID